jgi:HPt (histidine-containing phosphotransfer) domain-containing protein
VVRRIPPAVSERENQGVETIDWDLVLDREQLENVTLQDPQLMRDILDALIDDTSRQIGLMDLAIRDQDGSRCARLAHYSKGACTNCGANAAAAALLKIERTAAFKEYDLCRESLLDLAQEVERLRAEAAKV